MPAPGRSLRVCFDCDSNLRAFSREQSGWSAAAAKAPERRLWRDGAGRYARILARFSAGQLALQGITALGGLCLVRWLSVADFAVFGLSLALQQALGLVVDLGITSAIIALTGEQFESRRILGIYIQAGLHLRNRLLPAAALAGFGMIWITGQRQHWTLQTELAVFALVVAGILAQFWITLYGVPLILYRRLEAYYGILTGAAMLRLISVMALRWIGLLSAGPALAAGTLASLGAALLFRRAARTYWDAQPQVDEEAQSRILRYIGPRAPLVIFQSLQGQIGLFAVSYFGSSRPMAETGALGRLGQVFTLLNAFNWMIVGPRFARIGQEQVRPLYLKTAGVGLGIAAGAAGAAWFWPHGLLALIGPRYAHLEGPFRYVAATACLSYLSSLLLVIHNNRQWVFWWSAWLEIALVLGTQMVSVRRLSVGTTLGASQLACYTAVAVLAVQVMVGWSSLCRRPVRSAELG